jgi:signal transduction histidine kinase
MPERANRIFRIADTMLRHLAAAVHAVRGTIARSRAIRDLIPVGIVAISVYIVCGALDANERFMHWLLHQDAYQLDELPLVIIATSLGFAWYAIRRWKEYKQELRRRFALEQHLRVVAEEAELASRAKSEFLANMSHELRTPLNGILGFSEALAGGYFGALTPRQRDYVRDIHASGEHLLKIINDILDMSKLDAGRMILSEEDVDVADVLESCARLVRHRAEAAGITLTIENLMPGSRLRADELRLKQIVLNLMSNAVKFTPARGKVVVRTELDADGCFLLVVSDTGIGMRESDIAVALTPFAQVENFLTRKYEGTGLGLPIVNALVVLHGGRLEIRSVPNVGTTVTAVLPSERVIHEVAVAARPAETQAA